MFLLKKVQTSFLDLFEDGDSPALHSASRHGHVEVVKLLLAHPNINVNLKDKDGQTPFSRACQFRKVSVVQLMLNDPRVDLTLSDNSGRTPLWWASFNGHDEVIEWLIASGRDLGDVKNKKGKWNGYYCTAFEVARGKGNLKAMALLERFMSNPSRHAMKFV